MVCRLKSSNGHICKLTGISVNYVMIQEVRNSRSNRCLIGCERVRCLRKSIVPGNARGTTFDQVWKFAGGNGMRCKSGPRIRPGRKGFETLLNTEQQPWHTGGIY